MKKTDLIFIGIVLVGALWLAFLPNKRYQYHEISPKELIYQTSLNHYVTTDEVAKLIITKDPSVLFIDVRTPEEYATFSLPGALNIPYDSILNPSNFVYFNQDVYKTILFSNGSSLAEQAWLSVTRMGFENNYVMDGGLNEWIETIIKHPEPDVFAGKEEWEQYEFRKSASAYFGKAGGDVSTSTTSAPTPTAVVVPQKKDGGVGGCE